MKLMLAKCGRNQSPQGSNLHLLKAGNVMAVMRLRDALTTSRLTIAQAAELVCVDVSTIKRWLNGTSTIDAGKLAALEQHAGLCSVRPGLEVIARAV